MDLSVSSEADSDSDRQTVECSPTPPLILQRKSPESSTRGGCVFSFDGFKAICLSVHFIVASVVITHCAGGSLSPVSTCSRLSCPGSWMWHEGLRVGWGCQTVLVCRSFSMAVVWWWRRRRVAEGGLFKDGLERIAVLLSQKERGHRVPSEESDLKS